MAWSSREIAELRKIISIAQKLLAKATAEPKSRRTKFARPTSNAPNNSRRRGRDLVAFRKAIVAERKRGVPVVEIARKHGITPSYIYQMR